MNFVKLTIVLSVLILSGCSHVGSFTPTELNTLHELSYRHCKELGDAKFVTVYAFNGTKGHQTLISGVVIVCNNGVEIRVPYPSTPE